MAERFAGRYEFVDVLGDGGMGTVWRVWDHKEATFRAAKMLKQSDSASLLRFVRETSWRIDHEHVVTPVGWSAEDDRVLFTMPLVAGGTVATLARDFGALPGIWVGDLIGQLLSALVAVHAAGLVHRDIKPSNLLLDATGTGRPRLRLTDFGIAMAVDDPRMTRVGEVIGTPGYQSPEAFRGADPDPRQDLYSVGMVAVELLTGARPPSGSNADPVELAEIGQSSLAPVVGRLIEPDPERRFGSAQQALDALHGCTPTAWDRERSREIEVFDHLPPMPEGWTTHGPRETASPAPSQPEPLQFQRPPGQELPARELPIQHPRDPQPQKQQAWPPASDRPIAAGHGERYVARGDDGHGPANGTAAPPARRPAGIVFPLLAIGAGLILIAVAALLLS
ncbi:serine/threonine-protein kinase [Microlunatus soli]|uniref:non-specific serine/threonine protein kinase n=1 Tax=Microlunatus soli TaxID=630515 RepID=A0A1H1P106_9ACTN|nr:serine/threonine-protein kinase [Microlunatus soli]SDS04926.1 serine/threonine protein kinase [Microlunatus soli]